jgi:hypothetical protein
MFKKFDSSFLEKDRTKVKTCTLYFFFTAASEVTKKSATPFPT